MCLRFSCGGVGGIVVEWVGGLGQGLGWWGGGVVGWWGGGVVGWCYMCVYCESGLSVLMAGLGVCILC